CSCSRRRRARQRRRSRSRRRGLLRARPAMKRRARRAASRRAANPRRRAAAGGPSWPPPGPGCPPTRSAPGRPRGRGWSRLAAAALPDSVAAVVSRGGRPDLAGDRLAQVQAPTLLIVGGEDVQVLELNRRAATALRCRHELVVVEGATHLFEEPGALERVSELAIGWFQQHLA